MENIFKQIGVLAITSDVTILLNPFTSSVMTEDKIKLDNDGLFDEKIKKKNNMEIE